MNCRSVEESHHTLLHPPHREEPKDPEDTKSNTQPEAKGSVNAAQYDVTRTSAQKVCRRIVPVMIRGARQNRVANDCWKDWD